jgi:hypothetical protein
MQRALRNSGVNPEKRAPPPIGGRSTSVTENARLVAGHALPQSVTQQTMPATDSTWAASVRAASPSSGARSLLTWSSPGVPPCLLMTRVAQRPIVRLVRRLMNGAFTIRPRPVSQRCSIGWTKSAHCRRRLKALRSRRRCATQASWRSADHGVLARGSRTRFRPEVPRGSRTRFRPEVPRVPAGDSPTRRSGHRFGRRRLRLWRMASMSGRGGKSSFFTDHRYARRCFAAASAR